jgi:hypothetical protein
VGAEKCRLPINIAGVPVVGITAIEYDEKQTIENIYSMGHHLIGRGYGNIEPTATITCLMSEVEAFRAASPSGRLQDIAPFVIVVSYAQVNYTRIITHKIRNCQFTDNPVSHTQGSPNTVVHLIQLPSHIEWK